MNTNAIHNLINVVTILIAALEVFDWTPFFSMETSLKIVGGLGLLKLLINVVRDGFTGLTKEQPPVL